MSEITPEALLADGFVEIKAIGFAIYRKQGDKFPALSIHIGPVTGQVVAVTSTEFQSMTEPVKTMEDVRRIKSQMGLNSLKSDI